MVVFGLAILLVVSHIFVLEAMAGEPRVNIAEQPVSGFMESSSSESESAESPEIRRLGKHHSSDKSVAGGGVIIGGLVTAIFAAVFCYIRVTRKRDATR